MSVRFGIVGSGLMAGVFANALKEDTRNTQLIGVTVGKRAPGLAGKYGIEHIPTFEAMLARRDIDAVVLATPHSAHLSEALAAAKAGKHIFLEKPMALNTAECRRMIDAATSAGVKITVGHVTRRMEAPLVARRMIDHGEIGDVRMVQTWRGMVGGLPFPDGAWAKDPKEGGPFLDWGSHGCDVTRWYAGADPVVAFGQFAKYDAKETLQPSAMVQFTFANGVMGHVWMTYELPHATLGTRARYLVIGSKAILDIAAYGQVKRSRGPSEAAERAANLDIAAHGKATGSRTEAGWEVVYQSDDFQGPDAGWGYPSGYMRQAFARQVQDLTDAIAEGTPMDVSAEDGLKAVEMVEAAARSAETGQSVKMPLD